ncbi:lysosomal protective protein-like [Rhinatrema bivittatum]|uniref:lysosomal protective protein-like n=1 Tax=Rhinatrema bivittatum TaxID=194408 RepID=UPI0011285C39|nr:lysosomal protective protein-like [Rhinatrema bivittatum]
MNRCLPFRVTSFLLSVLLVGRFQVESAPKADEIVDLPGLDMKLTFLQYSGYLHILGKIHLHYWFVESREDPRNSPVVLWLNGGPGCSSLDGLLTEHGPFKIHTDGRTLKHNPYAWNKIANVLYLESPVGVGFSYSADKNYDTNDTQVSSRPSLLLLPGFLPEYSKNELFLTGESYGGFYIPTLAVLVMQDSSLDLKGIAVGNGLISYKINANSLMYFAYYHGLFGSSLWTSLQKWCCEDGECNFFDSTSIICNRKVSEANGIAYNPRINIYNLYSLCETETHGEIRYMRDLNVIHRFENLLLKFPEQKRVIQLHMAKFQKPLKGGMPCINATASRIFLNNPEVRKALHIPAEVPEWELCNDEVFRNYDSLVENVTEQYLKLLSTKKYRILLYNGDADMACNFMGVEWFVDSLKQKLQGTRRAWIYKDGNETQIGGFVKEFTNIMALTVKGAGHMVPTDNPRLAFIVFSRFLKNEPF